MTLGDRATDLRARTQVPESHTDRGASRGNPWARPPLRLIPGAAQVETEPSTPAVDHAGSSHFEDAATAVAEHPVTATHPPTVADAAGMIWPGRADVRHGLVGQLGAAAAGLVQIIGLAACWSIAHVFFATKTRAAVFALIVIAALTAYAVAGNA